MILMHERISESENYLKMSWRRAKTSGWAALDPKKQQEKITDNGTHNDPFPPISSNLGSCQNPTRNGNLTARSFSSMLVHSASAPNIMNDQAHVDSLTENRQSEENVRQLYEKLKELHPWANENLIEDIMAAVDNDMEEASTLLSEMASPAQVFKNNLIIKNDEPLEDHVFSRKVLLDDNVSLRLMMDSFSSVPVEPEWEDDDMYLIHRKEAIRAMRIASRHSKAATEAFLRRDHVAAQEFSQKAREEWSTADKLNAIAAKEILTLRNSENDDWRLDLHGLHATEAVHVLQEHLLKIESRVLGSRSSNPDKADRKAHSTRPRLLEVITGKGNHSRGEVALPVAIKSFLGEKGYHYYEARAGVITVQPKFRLLNT